MSEKDIELKAKDKVVTKMSSEGAVEQNLTQGTTESVSARLKDAVLVEALTAPLDVPILDDAEQKAFRKKHQIQQFGTPEDKSSDKPESKDNPKETTFTEEAPIEGASSVIHHSEEFHQAIPGKNGLAQAFITRKLTTVSDGGYVNAESVASRAPERGASGAVSASPTNRKLARLERKADKANDKLNAAREMLPTKRVIKSERVFDDATGKSHTRLRFEDEIKTPKSSNLGFAVKKDVRKLGDSLGDSAHGKIHEVEKENSSVEAAHKTEIVAETVARDVMRHEKAKSNKPYEKVSRLEQKADQASFKVHYEKTVQENPEMKGSGATSKFYQKQQIKKEYQAARRAGTQTAGNAGKAASSGAGKTGEKLSEKVGEFIRKNKKIFVWIGVGLLAVCLFIAGISSCTAMFSEMGTGVVVSSYLSEDADMLSAEAQYCGMEADLQYELDHYEALHPGYDEYRYDLDEIEHDPYVLISMLSALHGGEFTLDDVQSTLAMLFEKQYILTTTETVEVRYRTETRTGSYTVTDPDTGETTTVYYDYEVQVPYNYYILTVELENFNLSHVPVYIMSQDNLSMYAVYMSTLGNREDLFPNSPYVSKYITNPPQHYEVPAEYLDDETFAALITEAEKYLGYPYVWGGSNPNTSFDCSGFVSWVLTNSGLVNTGRLGAQGLYNVCTPVSATNVKPGDMVFFVGTYDTPGVSHVGIYVGDGVMLHCGDPIQYTSLNTSYWQQHFYAYGRPKY